MAIELDDIRNRFRVYYRANFQAEPFKTQDEADVWFLFLEDVPPFRHAELIDAVAKQRGKARWHPGLEAFKRAWDGITGGDNGTPANFCPHCNGGSVGVLCYREDSGRYVYTANLTAGHEPTLKTDKGIHIRYFPCACAAGRKIANGNDGEGAARRVDWVVDMKRAWNIQDTFNVDGIPMYRRWGWALADRERELIRESIESFAPEQFAALEDARAAGAQVGAFVDTEGGEA